MSKITVLETEIAVIAVRDEDYISLTDMARSHEQGVAMIERWLRNKNTLEFLGIWEEMYNPAFNSLKFEGIKNAAGLNRFAISVKQWAEITNSCGLIADAETMLRIIQSVPSKKAEPVKQWLAKVGYERMQEMADPTAVIDRARET